VFGVMKDKAIHFLEEHKEQLGLSEDNLETFENFYTAFIWVVVGLLLLEILRFHLSKHLREEIEHGMRQYREQLLDKRDDDKRSVRPMARTP
jgi:hypothetical protein